jgi:hypothetical protein
MESGQCTTKSGWARLANCIAYVGICIASYIVDCFLGPQHEGIPWIERGVFAGPWFLFTVSLVLAPVVLAIRNRIDSQPPG